MHPQELIQENIGCCEGILKEDSKARTLTKIMELAERGVRLVDKYTSGFMLEYFDRSKLECLEEIFRNPHIKMDVVQFVRFFLNAIDHKDHETLYLTMALLDTFKQLTQNRPGVREVTLFDLTNYFCEHIVDQDCSIKLSLHQLPSEKMTLPDLSRVRQIDKEAPFVHERAEVNLPKILKGNSKTDKTSHKSGPVEMIVYSQETNRLLTLDTLSTSIKIFDTNLNFKRQLSPSQAKSAKQLAIMSFAYSRKQQRIGCIIKDLGMSFWQFGDGLTTQKKILKTCGDRMYFFELFEEWVTTAGHLTHFWSIKDECIKYSIEGDPRSHINSVCEVPVLRLVCVAYSSDKKCHMDLRKLVLYSGKNIISQLQLGRAGCHSVHFNGAAQVLIPIGYRISIPIYTVHSQYYDFTKVAELVGHTSLVTCISDIGSSSLICTGDDVGFIRVWDLRMMRCIQVVKAARWLSHLLYIPDDKLIFTDSRVNMLNFEGFSLQKQLADQSILPTPSIIPISACYDADTKAILIATQKDVRVFEVDTGRLTDIYKVVADEDISAFTLGVGRRFLIGTDSGKINLFNKTGERINSFKAHSNEVFELKTDNLSQLVVTTSWDGDIGVWRESLKGELSESEKSMTLSKESRESIIKEPYRRIRSIVRSRLDCHGEIAAMCFSVYHSILVTASPDHNILLWDYEYCKLIAKIEITSEPTFVHLTDEYPLLLVGGKDGLIWVFELRRKEFKVTIKLLTYFGIQDPKERPKSSGFITQACRTFSNFDEFKSNFISKMECHRFLIPDKVLVDFCETDNRAYFAFEDGFVTCFNLNVLVNSVSKSENFTKKQNYNPQRHCSETVEDEVTIYPMQLLKNQFERFDCWQAVQQTKMATLYQQWIQPTHKGRIVSMAPLNTPQKHLLTSSTDGWFKLSRTSTGEVVCAYNLNHPLPLKWNLWVNPEQQLTDKISQGLRTIALIFQRYPQDITINEAKVLSIKPLLQRINQQQNEPTQMIDQSQKGRCILLSQEYTPADLNPHYPRPQHKPTLKELEAYKRVYLSSTNKPVEGKQLSQSAFMYDEKAEQRDSIAEFLNPSCVSKLTWKGIDSFEKEEKDTPYIRSLMSKFEGNRMRTEQNQNLVARKGKQKEKTDLVAHARMKSYLSQNDQPKVSSILQSINQRIDEVRRRHNRLTSRALDPLPKLYPKKPSQSMMETLPR